VDQILLLRDARFVAQFQRYFGLELKAKSSKIRTNGDGIASGNHDYKNGLKQLNGNIKSHGIKHTREIVEDDSSSNNDGNHETCNYKINNIFWYYLFSFGASLGYETFYATFFPFWFWNIDSAVGRRMVLVWVIIMYFGQVLKDIIRWPRPASPPVVILEPEYAVEFGMPSTHAMVGSALPTTILIFTMHRYEVRHGGHQTVL
jgi:sphingosine-1-phosphate phosphatase 1